MAWDLSEAISYYQRQGAPADQSALVSLLSEVQQEHGGSIPLPALSAIAETMNIKESYLQAIIRRIPRLRLSGKHTMILCAGPNCSKRAALAEFVERTYGRNPSQFTLQFGPCMRQCGKGPNLQWDGKLYNGATEALIHRLVEGKEVQT